MSYSNLNDDAVFDRLVDGEMSAEDRRRLLSSLDGRVDGWRRCATAFLEAQALGSQFKAIVTDGGQFGQRTPLIGASKADVALPRRSTARSLSSAQQLALAATLLLAFGAGWLLAVSGDSPVDKQSLFAVGREPAETSASHQPLAGAESDGRQSTLDAPNWDDDDVVALWVRDQGGQARRLQLPLLEFDGSDDRLDEGAWTPPAALSEYLRENGLDVRTRRRYAPVFFEHRDGFVPMVVPVNDAYVTPVRRQIY